MSEVPKNCICDESPPRPAFGGEPIETIIEAKELLDAMRCSCKLARRGHFREDQAMHDGKISHRVKALLDASKHRIETLTLLAEDMRDVAKWRAEDAGEDVPEYGKGRPWGNGVPSVEWLRDTFEQLTDDCR